ncbi:MAG TPA: protein phosphatase 2C domain-containing protein [Sphingomicrobium sp.]|jgi:serine/threonine protein phosphatase PrpC|nr:protein phosphatase 2C domain-containing protein [Sphingomicrobium sp.]
MRFECVSRTHVGLRRKINEDSLLADPERGLWAVADGMGGHEAGEIASNMVTDALRCLPEASGIDDLVARAVDALHEVNRELVALARAGGHKATIGTTVVGLAMADGAFRCFWAGDSRAYRLRDGAITRLSRDHSLVQNLIDAGMLAPEDAETHENANLITRAVGAAEKVEVDVASGDARPGDQFLLASDGLTRVMRDDELAAELERGPLDQVADTLIETVLARGAPDNVSLVLAKVL